MTRSAPLAADGAPARTPAAASVVTEAGHSGPRGPRRLGRWRLEWLRLVRTRRWVLLVLAFPVLAGIAPFVARHLDEILDVLGADKAGRPRALGRVEGMAAFVYAVGQIGGILTVALTASALAVDHKPGLAAFHRTRTRRPRDLVVPRITVITAAVTIAYILATLIAWAQTHWLFGPLPAGRVLFGMLCALVQLLLLQAMVAAMAGVLRRPVAMFGATLVGISLLPLSTLWRPIREWSPNKLTDAPVTLLQDARPGEYTGSIVVSLLFTALFLWFSIHRIGRREM